MFVGAQALAGTATARSLLHRSGHRGKGCAVSDSMRSHGCRPASAGRWAWTPKRSPPWSISWSSALATNMTCEHRRSRPLPFPDATRAATPAPTHALAGQRRPDAGDLLDADRQTFQSLRYPILPEVNTYARLDDEFFGCGGKSTASVITVSSCRATSISSLLRDRQTDHRRGLRFSHHGGGTTPSPAPLRCRCNKRAAQRLTRHAGDILGRIAKLTTSKRRTLRCTGTCFVRPQDR